MKNLAKFFVAVAALFVGVSCTTDTTEDLAPTVIGKSDFSITVSTGGDVRTSLGEKADDAYPIYWSKGDKLSLNGAASAALPTMEEPTNVATFTWEGLTEEQQTAPFFVLYPASTEPNTVTFDATQGYVKGTFQSGSVPMFGYAESVEALENIQLQYLAGVLKIGFWYDLDGSEDEKAPKLERIFIESLDGTPIAGKFNVDKDANLTPTEDTNTSLYYTPSGQSISTDVENPTYLHIAVPKGAYETLLLKVISDKGTMIAKIKAGEDSAKGAIVAGQVREFGVVKYDITSDGTELSVTEQADLEELRANPTKYQTVYINDDFTVSNWNTPIEDFAGVVVGNDKTITGLNAPLFGTTTAEIKNLHLAAVDINETEAAYVGAFARRMSYGGILSGCTVESGTIAYSGTRNDSDPKVIFLGGLVGSVNVASSLIENCTNKATISFPDTASAASILIGGIAGHTVCTLNSVKNEGTISAYGTVNGGTNTTHFDGSTENAPLTQYIVGGLVGVSQTGTATSCENWGTVNVGGSTTLLNEVYPSIGFAGCFGAKHSGNIKTLDNHGKVNISCNISDGDAEKNTPIYIAGVVAYGGSSKLNTVKNHSSATVTASGTHSYSSGTADANGNIGAPVYYVSGIVARGSNVAGNDCESLTNDAAVTCNIIGEKVNGNVAGVLNGTHHSEISGATNNGTITFGENAVVGGYLYLGGCCSNWDNVKATGYINNGDVKFLGKADRFLIGGVCGYAAIAISNATNTGNLTVAGEITNTDGAVYTKVGGVIGYSSVTIGGTLTNGVEGDTTKGNITISTTGIPVSTEWPKSSHGTCFGGIIGHAQSGAVDGCTNHGAIELSSTFASKPGSNIAITLGGISGYCGGKVINSTNNGKVTFSGEVSVAADLTVAGICARNGNNQGCTGCTNNGAIVVSGDSNNSISAAGLVTLCAGGTYSDLTNNGPITVSGKTKTLNVGGIVSHETSNKTSNVVFNDCHNTIKGIITISGATYTTLSVGGLAGQVVHSTGPNRTIESCSNAAAIKVTDAVTVSTTTCIGGITGNWVPKETTGFIKESTNSGKLEFAGTSTENLYFGGIVGWSKKGELNACTNKGEVVFSGKASDSAFVSGVAGTGCNLIKDCWNKANISATSTSSVKNYILLGGVCGGSSHYLTEGLTSSASGAAAALVLLEVNGGGCGYIDDDPTKKPLITIETTPGKTPRIGGVVGYLTGIATSEGAYHTLQGITNNADLTYNTGGTIKDGTIGGVLGYTSGTITLKNCTNNGNLTIKNNGKYIGGITGSNISNAKYTLDYWANLTNTGNIVVENASTNFYAAGILPRSDANTTAAALKGLHNSGDITVNEGVAQTTNVGGIAGYCPNKMDYCSSTGDLCVYNTVVTLSSGSKSTNYVGMFNGSNKAGTARKISNSLVSGKIKRYTDAAPITIDDSNYMNYLFRDTATAGTYENISTTEMPQEPAEE